jgi:hypothetical protein
VSARIQRTALEQREHRRRVIYPGELEATPYELSRLGRSEPQPMSTTSARSGRKLQNPRRLAEAGHWSWYALVTPAAASEILVAQPSLLLPVDH